MPTPGSVKIGGVSWSLAALVGWAGLPEPAHVDFVQGIVGGDMVGEALPNGSGSRGRIEASERWGGCCLSLVKRLRIEFDATGVVTGRGTVLAGSVSCLLMFPSSRVTFSGYWCISSGPSSCVLWKLLTFWKVSLTASSSCFGTRPCAPWPRCEHPRTR